jgi:hypothetical protein
MRKCANGELLSYFQAEVPMHRPSFFSFFFTYDKRYFSYVITISPKKNQDNSFNFRFQIGNGRQSKRLLQTCGEYFFYIIIFLDKNKNTGFSSRHLLRLQKFCITADIYPTPFPN